MWGWDPVAYRYRDTETGRFLPRGQVLDYVDQSISAGGIASDLLAGYAGDGTLSPGDFVSLLRNEIRDEYIRQYLLGIGGREQMTQVDWGSVGGMIADQYRYLDGFLADIEAGNLTPEQIAARARMYINSAREAFERAHGRVAKKAGCDEEIWSLGEAEHCGDCVEYAGMGWQPIGTFPEPGDGSTQCMTNCKCSKAYRNSETGVTI